MRQVGQKVSRMPGSPARSRGSNSPPVSLPPANGLTRAQGPHSLKGSGCQHHCPPGHGAQLGSVRLAERGNGA